MPDSLALKKPAITNQIYHTRKYGALVGGLLAHTNPHDLPRSTFKDMTEFPSTSLTYIPLLPIIIGLDSLLWSISYHLIFLSYQDDLTTASYLPCSWNSYRNLYHKGYGFHRRSDAPQILYICGYGYRECFVLQKFEYTHVMALALKCNRRVLTFSYSNMFCSHIIKVALNYFREGMILYDINLWEVG